MRWRSGWAGGRRPPRPNEGQWSLHSLHRRRWACPRDGLASFTPGCLQRLARHPRGPQREPDGVRPTGPGPQPPPAESPSVRFPKTRSIQIPLPACSQAGRRDTCSCRPDLKVPGTEAPTVPATQRLSPGAWGRPSAEQVQPLGLRPWLHGGVLPRDVSYTQLSRQTPPLQETPAAAQGIRPAAWHCRRPAASWDLMSSGCSAGFSWRPRLRRWGRAQESACKVGTEGASPGILRPSPSPPPASTSQQTQRPRRQ